MFHLTTSMAASSMKLKGEQVELAASIPPNIQYFEMNALPSFTSLVGGFVEGISISNMYVIFNRGKSDPTYNPFIIRLFGISVAQFYLYTQHWERDSKWLKSLAIAIV